MEVAEHGKRRLLLWISESGQTAVSHLSLCTVGKQSGKARHTLPRWAGLQSRKNREVQRPTTG